jgi:DNA-binding transcriptional regulator YiaG
MPDDETPTVAVTAADIRAARARIDETQSQFAIRFGVDRSTIAAWEKHGAPSRGAAKLLISKTIGDIYGKTP